MLTALIVLIRKTRMEFGDDFTWADLKTVFKARLALLLGITAVAFVLSLVVVLFVAGCGAPPPTENRAPGGTPFGTTVKTLPTSRHVTGSYPKLCTLTGSPGKWLPDKACTPGAGDAAVRASVLGTPGNLRATICTPGWVGTARAPDQELVPVKAAAVVAYNVRGQSVLNYLVPLSLGGSSDVSNLWVMPVEIGNPKDRVDATLNKAVCSGTISLGAAQNAIANNWITATKQLGLGG